MADINYDRFSAEDLDEGRGPGPHRVTAKLAAQFSDLIGEKADVQVDLGEQEVLIRFSSEPFTDAIASQSEMQWLNRLLEIARRRGKQSGLQTAKQAVESRID